MKHMFCRDNVPNFPVILVCLQKYDYSTVAWYHTIASSNNKACIGVLFFYYCCKNCPVITVCSQYVCHSRFVHIIH